MGLKGTLDRNLPVDVTFAADLANANDAYVDHYPTPSDGTNVVFMDVTPGSTPTTTNTFDTSATSPSRRFNVEYNLATGDKGTLTVKQAGVTKATAAIPDGDVLWLFVVL